MDTNTTLLSVTVYYLLKFKIIVVKWIVQY